METAAERDVTTDETSSTVSLQGTVDGAVRSVTVTDAALSLWSKFPVEIAWSVDQAAPGDTVTVRLPPEVRPLTDGFDLRTDDDELVATADVADQTLSFTYTDYVATHRDLTGTATIPLRFDATEVSADTDLDLVFRSGDAAFTVPVTVLPEQRDPGTARFYGYWTDAVHEDRVEPDGALQWRVVTPVGPAADAVVHGTAAGGHAVDCDSFQVRRLTEFAANGDVTEAHMAPADALEVRSCDAAGFTVALGSVAPGDATMVLYTSTVTDAGVAGYDSRARLLIDGESADLDSQVGRSLSGGSGQGTSVTTVTTVGTTGSAVSGETQASEQRLTAQTAALWIGAVAVAVVAAALLSWARRRNS
ncbi:Ig-like domain-containing protein [Georgenia halophila]|uniref:Ig-like domain-containing protein n=1 Tax=Georgenia halophila TaxID=620889 RepID=UPI0031EFB429